MLACETYPTVGCVLFGEAILLKQLCAYIDRHTQLFCPMLDVLLPRPDYSRPLFHKSRITKAPLNLAWYRLSASKTASHNAYANVAARGFEPLGAELSRMPVHGRQ